MISRAVLCLNLGSPDAPTPGAIRRYLNNFLDDPRVIAIPTLARKILLWGVILPFRPYKVVKAYRAIWDPEKGSPLVWHSKDFAKKLQTQLGESYPVALGMRHGHPDWNTALEALLEHTPETLIIFPQFPQYASATTGSVLEVVLKRLAKEKRPPKIKVVWDFYDHPAFISALRAVIQPYCTSKTTLVLSYHGLPVRDLVKIEGEDFPCDQAAPCPLLSEKNQKCYRAQCYATSRALIAVLGLPEEQVHTSFQSRLGRVPWIQPYTDEYLQKLRAKGVEEVVLACPAFTADCLETLEEIGIGLKEQWAASGGKSFTLVPCLNDHDSWVQAAAEILTSSEHAPYVPVDVQVV